jgi:Protein of unknown function (DUF1573)
MKRYALILILPCLLAFCKDRNMDKIAKENKQNQTKDSTTVKIIDSAYNFGTVTDGELVNFSYRFVNTGKKDLVIFNAHASCGCTVPQKPEEPIKPGDTGYIKIVFDSKGRVGEAHKSISVQSNAYPPFGDLQLTGTVKAAGDKKQ